MKNGGRMVSRCHLRNKGVNVMTENELIELKKSFEQNELFQKSISPYTYFQREQFCMNGEVLTGVFSKVDKIDDVDCLVIFNFDDDGLIHSNDDNSPAIEYPNHHEFWDHGYITKVVQLDGECIEYWENGIPVRIERNVSNR